MTANRIMSSNLIPAVSLRKEMRFIFGVKRSSVGQRIGWDSRATVFLAYRYVHSAILTIANTARWAGSLLVGEGIARGESVGWEECIDLL